MDGLQRVVEVSGAEDGFDEFGGGEAVDGDGDVGLAVEGEAAVVAALEVGAIGEDGAAGLGSGAAGEGGFKQYFEVDEEGCGLGEEQRADGVGLDGAAAESEDETVFDRELGDGGVLALAEAGFAVLAEDFRDGTAGGGDDNVVGVDKAPAESRGEERADGAFARAHEAGEDDAAGGGAAFGWIGVGHDFSIGNVGEGIPIQFNDGQRQPSSQWRSSMRRRRSDGLGRSIFAPSNSKTR
jgi:hypothetical protein